MQHCVTAHLKPVYRLFAIIMFTIANLLANPPVSSENVPPRLPATPIITAHPDMIKQGLWGATSVEADIDSIGTVVACTVTASGNAMFDSLVKWSVEAKRFTPAIENGHPVRAVVAFAITVDRDSLVAQCMQLPPKVTGIVIDTMFRKPVNGAKLFLHCIDSTVDRALTIGYTNYMSLIGTSPGQHYNGTVIATTTDSLGRFFLRLLPAGNYRISIQAAGFEPGRFITVVDNDKTEECRFALRQLEEEYHQGAVAPELENSVINGRPDEIMVYGKHDFSEKTVVLEKKEWEVGFSPMLSNVVQSRAEIRRVPEGPSKMLVRSGNPYDNVYVIAGIPMLAPFHFGGHPYADIDGIMISALSEVTVTIDDIAAKRPDASGCIIEADPSKVKYDNGNDARGFFVKGDMSMHGADLLAAYTAKQRPDDYFQIGVSACNVGILSWENEFYKSVAKGNYGIGIPLHYGNATVAGSKSSGRLRYSAFGWLAWDAYDGTKGILKYNDNSSSYRSGEDIFLPWGMGSVKIGTDSSGRSLTIGGAHQFFGSGKQYQSTLFTTRSFLDNGEVVVDLDTIVRFPVAVTMSGTVSCKEWSGVLVKEENSIIDTLLDREGEETSVSCAAALIKETGRIVAQLDLLGSAVTCAGKEQFNGDAGVSLSYGDEAYHAGIHLGRVTSRPDSRGIVDEEFRLHRNRIYLASIPLFLKHGRITKLGITPYLRYCTAEPRLDPVYQTWEPDETTPMLARGADCRISIIAGNWMDAYSMVNLADTRRLDGNNDSIPYEWNLPWTIRCGMHLHFVDEMLHLYIDYVRTKGLPYFDREETKYAALPEFQNLDLTFQIRNRRSGHRYIKQLDCYFAIKNLLDLSGTANVRDYYWDSRGLRQPLFLGSGRIDFGARFGIRL